MVRRASRLKKMWSPYAYSRSSASLRGLVFLVFLTAASGTATPGRRLADAERCDVAAVRRALPPGGGASCGNVTIAGMQSSGSTLVYQLARGVMAHGSRATTLSKTHRFDLVYKADGGAPCALVTYRDFRDVLCSTARRQGDCADCSASAMEAKLKSWLGRLFSGRYRWEEWLPRLETDGAVMLRYEAAADCPRELLRALAAWRGVAPPLPHTEEKLLAESSLDANLERAAKLKRFGAWDPATQVHGNHISNGGLSGGWRSCFTPAVEAHVRQVLGGLLERYGYSWD